MAAAVSDCAFAMFSTVTPYFFAALLRAFESPLGGLHLSGQLGSGLGEERSSIETGTSRFKFRAGFNQCP